MDFSKLELLIREKAIKNQQSNECNGDKTTPVTQKTVTNQQSNECNGCNAVGTTVYVEKKEILSYNLKNNEVIEDKKNSLMRRHENDVTPVTTLQGEKNDITTRRKRFDLSNLFIPNTAFDTREKSVTNCNDTCVTDVTSPFDELGYVSDKYDHLSDQYQSQPGSFWSRYTKQVRITPQQALGIKEVSKLEQQIIDFLKKNGVWSVKHVATELKQNEEEIRTTAQKSELIEYRKCSDGYESLLLEDVNYPARFVAFIESLESIDLDDLLQLLKKTELYLKEHGKEHLNNWIEFCTRFVIYHKDDDNPAISLRKALIYQL